MDVRTVITRFMRFACALVFGLAGLQSSAIAKDKKDDKKVVVTKLKTTQDLSKVLNDRAKANDFTAIKVTKAWYGTEKNKKYIDVASVLQPYADKGILPDPDVEVAKARQAGSLTEAQLKFPAEQAMNIFFGKDPDKGTAKFLHIEFTVNKMVGTENVSVNYVVDMPEHKASRGTYDAFPVGPAPASSSGSQPEPTPDSSTSSSTPSTDTSSTANAAVGPTTDFLPPTGEILVVNQVDTAKVSWPAAGTITIQQLADAMVKNNMSPFTINDAWYGVEGNANNLTVDAKAKLQSFADKGIFVVPDKMTDFFGKDPVKGKKKTLFVSFSMQGNTYNISIPEKKKDRGVYSLPQSKVLFGWGQGRNPGKPEIQWFRQTTHEQWVEIMVKKGKTSGLTYEERLNNAFDILGNKPSDADKKLFMSELTYLVNNRSGVANAESLRKLIKMADRRFEDDTPYQAQIDTLAQTAGVDLTVMKLLTVLKKNADLSSDDQKSAFIAKAQELLALNQNGKTTADEISQFQGILFAGLKKSINKDDDKTYSVLAGILNKTVIAVTTESGVTVTAPASSTPGTSVAATAVMSTTSKFPLPATPYSDRIAAAVAMPSVFANTSAADAFLKTLNDLVADRAQGSADDLKQLLDLLTYYASVNTSIKQSSSSASQLQSMIQTLNSGIAYADRLNAVDPLIKGSNLSDGFKKQMFNILSALANEQAKADIAPATGQLAQARAFLVVAQMNYTGDADVQALTAIQNQFNTPPVATATPAEQATAATPAATTPATSAQPDATAAAATAVATQVVTAATTAATAAATGTTPATPVADSALYADQLTNCMSSLVAAKAANNAETTAAAIKTLKGLVDNRALADTQAETQMLNMCLQYATLNFTDATSTAALQDLAKTMGTNMSFATQVQSFANLLSSPSFATSPNQQADALSLAQTLASGASAAVANKTATVDDIINLKANLIAAQRLFTKPDDAAKITALQTGVTIPSVSNTALPAATTAAESTAAAATSSAAATTVTTGQSYSDAVKAAAAITTFASDADKNSYVIKLQGLVNDRACGAAADITALNDVLKAASANAALVSVQPRIQAMIARMAAPVTNEERVQTIEEMLAMTLTAQQISQVVGILTTLSQDIANVNANELVRIKANMLILKPQVTVAADVTAFNAAEAIFNAPAQVVAPTATTQAGGTVSQAVTQTTAGQAAATVATAAATPATRTSSRRTSSSRTRTTTTSSDTLSRQLTSYQKSLATAQQRLATAKTPGQRTSYQAQVTRYTKLIADTQAKITAAQATATTAAPVAATTTPAAPSVATTTQVVPTTMPVVATPAVVTAPAEATPAATTTTVTPATTTSATPAATAPATTTPAATTTPVAAPAAPVTTTATAPAVPATTSTLSQTEISRLQSRLTQYQGLLTTAQKNLAKATTDLNKQILQGAIDRYTKQIQTIQAQLGQSTATQPASTTPTVAVAP